MINTPGQEIRLFFCYAREDKLLREELEKHLSWLKRLYHITNWHDREILPGEEWKKIIDRQLNTAHLILLLISPDFMASDYCYSKEMLRALERHKAGTCRVIPILLRPTFWENAPFSHLQILPTDARPITSWPNRDEAFQDVVTEISRAVKDLLASIKTKQNWLDDGDVLRGLTHYEEALAAYKRAIDIDPNYAIVYINMGITLNYLMRHEEALNALEQALRIDPSNATAYVIKGLTLSYLMSYEEALKAYEQALRIDLNNVNAYINIGIALNYLMRHEVALTVYEQAIRIDPDNIAAYTKKGMTLNYLMRHEEALKTLEEAVRIDPNNVDAHINKGITLNYLMRHEEALAAYEQAIRIDPDNVDAYGNMGIALSDLKRYKEANQMFGKARQLW